LRALLSLKLRHIMADDEAVRLLMTIPGVGYYIALLVKAEIGDISRARGGVKVAEVGDGGGCSCSLQV
jgi:hypothetical protein